MEMEMEMEMEITLLVKNPMNVMKLNYSVGTCIVIT